MGHALTGRLLAGRCHRRTSDRSHHARRSTDGQLFGRLLPGLVQPAPGWRATPVARHLQVNVADSADGVLQPFGFVDHASKLTVDPTVVSSIHRPSNLRLPELPRSRTIGTGRSSPPETKHPQLSHPRLRQGVRQDVSLEGSLEVAHRGAALRLQLALLRKTLHPVRRAAKTPSNAHRRKAIRVPHLQQEVHEVGPPVEARQDPQPKRGGKEERLRGRQRLRDESISRPVGLESGQRQHASPRHEPSRSRSVTSRSPRSPPNDNSGHEADHLVEVELSRRRRRRRQQNSSQIFSK